MKNLIRLILIYTVVVLLPSRVTAQQQALYAQYMFNQMVINPAYTGSNGYTRGVFSLRQQWVGLEGAPNTQTFTIDAPINKNRSAALGAILIADKIGVTSQNGAFLTYSKSVRLNETYKLSMGLQGGVYNYKFEESKLNNIDPDPIIGGDINALRSNFGLGLFLESQRFFFGLSIPQTIESSLDLNNEDSDAKARRHYFTNMGYVITLNKDLKLKPNVLATMVEGNPLQIDFNMSLFIRELLWFGLSYRSFDAMDVILQARLTDRIQFGYAYDFANTKTGLRRINGGSHEFMLTFNLLSRDKYTSPRYF